MFFQVPSTIGTAPEFVLEMDETYAPQAAKSEEFSTPHLREPLPCAYCLLEETPYVMSIRTVLKEALNRPTSVLHKEKFLCFNFCLEQLAAPIFVVRQKYFFLY